MAVLNETDRKEKLDKLNGWQFQNNSIEKEYTLKDFKSALNFVNKLGEEAEKMDHHPDINIHSYNKVKIILLQFQSKIFKAKLSLGESYYCCADLLFYKVYMYTLFQLPHSYYFICIFVYYIA